MANSSFINIPEDVTDPVSLRRFLGRLVEQLDVAFGNSGIRTQTATVDDLRNASSRSTTIETNYNSLDSRISALEKEVGI